MTILLQSSSAAIAVTLAALASQAIYLEQTVVLVMGQNVGTVVTAVLAEKRWIVHLIA
jgi:phosphate:Na+ symporter